jgi:hypothetical protein
MIILEAFCVDYPSLHVGLHYSPLHPSTVFLVEIECEGTRVFLYSVKVFMMMGD